MENRNKIIIIGFVIILIALVGITFYMFNGQQQQSATQIKIAGNKTIEEDGTLTVKLSSLNGTGIKHEKINITVIDKKNKEVLKKTVKTNSKGKAKVDLDNISKGKYIVNITFEGNENYSANNTSEKIKIIEKVVETETETTSEETQTTESTQQNEEYSDDLGLSQHKASDWEYTGTSADGEHYSDGRGGELVMHEQGQYEYYDGQGHVVGGFYD